ncbi:MAG: hypothetical protein ACXAC2_11185 [Candidatus Kariarchaeaceae archaeon]|jgi:hypothetical protein
MVLLIIMSVIVHTRHSVELLEYITRRFNGVTGYNLIKIKSNNIGIDFPIYQSSDLSIINKLFTKLVEAFKVIKNKYISREENHKHVQVKFTEDNEYIRIKITGTLYIPPNKFLSLYGLILWYYIRYITGQKPSLSDKGKYMSDQWKSEQKVISKEINSLPRRKIVNYLPHPCNICGQITYVHN